LRSAAVPDKDEEPSVQSVGEASVILVRLEQLKNTLPPMLLAAGKDTLVSDRQPLNALLPIDVTAGKDTLASAVHL
jgi:hypothetical protein